MKASDKVTKPRDIRHRLGLNQQEFWGRIGVTQSGGSRYESGRTMPKPVQELLRLVHVDQIDVRKITRGDFQVISYLKASEPALYKRFRAQVVKRTQLNASFYGSLPALQVQAERNDFASDAGFSLLETQSPYSIDAVIRKDVTVAQPLPGDVKPPITVLREVQGSEDFSPTDSAANTLSGPEARDGQGEAHLA